PVPEPRTLYQGKGKLLTKVTFSPDGRRLAGACPPKLLIWDVQTSQNLLHVEGIQKYTMIDWSPDGKVLGIGGNAQLWDSSTGKACCILRDLSGAPEKSALNYSYGVAFSRDGRLFAEGGSLPAVRVWDTTSGRRRYVFQGGPPKALTICVAFSPDCKLLA